MMSGQAHRAPPRKEARSPHPPEADPPLWCVWGPAGWLLAPPLERRLDALPHTPHRNTPTDARTAYGAWSLPLAGGDRGAPSRWSGRGRTARVGPRGPTGRQLLVRSPTPPFRARRERKRKNAPTAQRRPRPPRTKNGRRYWQPPHQDGCAARTNGAGPGHDPQWAGGRRGGRRSGGGVVTRRQAPLGSPRSHQTQPTRSRPHP